MMVIMIMIMIMNTTFEVLILYQKIYQGLDVTAHTHTHMYTLPLQRAGRISLGRSYDEFTCPHEDLFPVL